VLFGTFLTAATGDDEENFNNIYSGSTTDPANQESWEWWLPSLPKSSALL